MKRIIVAVQDLKVGIRNIISYTTEGEAIRSFGEGCRDEKTELAKFPEDFILLKLGELDEKTGEITPEIKTLATATQYIKKGREEK
jgi:hypothetical protein